MATLTREQKIDKAKAYTVARTTKLLVQSLRGLEPQIDAARDRASITKAEADYITCEALNQSRSWIIEELEARYPAASAAVEAAFEAGDDVDYDAVLINAIPASER